MQQFWMAPNTGASCSCTPGDSARINTPRLQALLYDRIHGFWGSSSQIRPADLEPGRTVQHTSSNISLPAFLRVLVKLGTLVAHRKLAHQRYLTMVQAESASARIVLQRHQRHRRTAASMGTAASQSMLENTVPVSPSGHLQPRISSTLPRAITEGVDRCSGPSSTHDGFVVAYVCGVPPAGRLERLGGCGCGAAPAATGAADAPDPTAPECAVPCEASTDASGRSTDGSSCGMESAPLSSGGLSRRRRSSGPVGVSAAAWNGDSGVCSSTLQLRA